MNMYINVYYNIIFIEKLPPQDTIRLKHMWTRLRCWHTSPSPNSFGMWRRMRLRESWDCMSAGWPLGGHCGILVKLRRSSAKILVTPSLSVASHWFSDGSQQKNKQILNHFFSKKSWPSAATLVFQDYVFFGIYIMELVLRFCAFGPRALTEKTMAFWWDPHNWKPPRSG